ncbi:MAG: hypothetical protein AAGK32_06235, partial [Actinomycetota bacterium]
MTARRRVLSVGAARSTWPRDVARWSTAGLIDADHHHCLSVDEMRRLVSVEPVPDVVLVEASVAIAASD